MDIKLGSHIHKSNKNKNFEFKERTLLLESQAYNQIKRLIAKSTQIEQVGLIFGSFQDSTIKTKEIIPMDNLDNSRTSFSLDYEVMLEKIQFHEDQDLLLLGFFHTHLGNVSIYPSEKDRFYMRYWPYPYIWMIASTAPSSFLRIFSLYNNKIIEIQYSLN